MTNLNGPRRSFRQRCPGLYPAGLRALAVLSSLASCDHLPEGSASQVGVERLALVGGRVSDAYAAVGQLTLETPVGSSLCTASLVSPSKILTAAHCLEELAWNSHSAPAVFELGLEPQRSQVRRRVIRAVVHPGYEANAPGQGVDLAVGDLDSPILDVLPVAVSFVDGAALVGETLTLVGYGRGAGGGPARGPTVESEAGIRRVTTVTASRVDSNYLYSTVVHGGVCGGDSGGPAIALIAGQPRQVGVASFGDLECALTGGHARLDRHQTWLQAMGVPEASSETAEYCVAEGVCHGGCARDDDCKAFLCPAGTCGPPVQSCQPVAHTMADSACYYISVEGEVCATAPIVQIDFDPVRKQCLFTDRLGTLCAEQCARCSESGLCHCAAPTATPPTPATFKLLQATR